MKRNLKTPSYARGSVTRATPSTPGAEPWRPATNRLAPPVYPSTGARSTGRSVFSTLMPVEVLVRGEEVGGVIPRPVRGESQGFPRGVHLLPGRKVRDLHRDPYLPHVVQQDH